MQNTIRTTALLFFIMVISIITTSNKIKNLPVGFIAVSLGLNWLLMVYFGAKLRRFKIWAYPIMFIINPFFNWVYMVYGIFTAGQRTWGGPRADAGAADTSTTPQQAIEHAKATGDDLNVIPETFKPAVAAQHPERGPSIRIPVQPTDHVEGRFAPAERLPGGWYLQKNDSGTTLPDSLTRNPNAPRLPLHPRDSFDSLVTTASPTNSVYQPRRVESIMNADDLRKYSVAQNSQELPRGAYMSMDSASHGKIYEMGDEPDHKAPWSESVESLGSGEETPPHVQELTRRSRYSNTYHPDSDSPPIAPTSPTHCSANDSGIPDLGLPPIHHPPAPQNSTHGRLMRTERSPLSQSPLARHPTRRENSESIEMARRDPLVARQDQQMPGQILQPEPTKRSQASQQPLMGGDGARGEIEGGEEAGGKGKRRNRLFKRRFWR